MQRRTSTIIVNEYESGRLQAEVSFNPPMEASKGEKSSAMNAMLPLILSLLPAPDVVLQANGITVDEVPGNVPIASLSISGTPVARQK